MTQTWHAGRVTDEQPGRLARLWKAADARNVPLRTIVATVAVVAAAYMAGKLIYRLRDILLLVVVAGFLALLLNPIVVLLQRHPAFRRGASRSRSSACWPCWSSSAWSWRSACRWSTGSRP